VGGSDWESRAFDNVVSTSFILKEGREDLRHSSWKMQEQRNYPRNTCDIHFLSQKNHLTVADQATRTIKRQGGQG